MQIRQPTSEGQAGKKLMTSLHNAVIRDGRPEDAMMLASFAMAAGHGLLEIFYGGLIPGRSTQQAVAERRILRPGAFAEFHRWRVLEDGAGTVLGGLNAFPHDVFNTAAPDELLTAERLDSVASLSALEASADGTFYVNMIAVAPEARGKGAGASLMAEAERLARAAGFGVLTLSTFEADAGLIRFYQRNGFEVIGTAPIAPHPLLEYGGNWALLAKTLPAAV